MFCGSTYAKGNLTREIPDDPLQQEWFSLLLKYHWGASDTDHWNGLRYRHYTLTCEHHIIVEPFNWNIVIASISLLYNEQSVFRGLSILFTMQKDQGQRISFHT